MGFVSTIFSSIIFLSPFFAQNSDDAGFYFKKASIEYESGMLAYAEENLTRALEYNPSLYKACAMMGDIKIKKGFRAEALAWYNRSLSITESQDDIHFKAGELEDYYDNRDKALLHFLRACELNPGNVYAAAGASRIFSLNGDRKKADTFFQQSYASGIQESRPLVKKFEQAYARKNFTDAQFYLREAIRKNPADEESYYRLSALYRLEKKSIDALRTLEKLRFLRPYDEKLLVQLAHTYYTEHSYKNRKQEISEAISCMEKAAELNPSSAEHQEFLAELYKVTGDEKKYKTSIDRAHFLNMK